MTENPLHFDYLQLFSVLNLCKFNLFHVWTLLGKTCAVHVISYLTLGSARCASPAGFLSVCSSRVYMTCAQFRSLARRFSRDAGSGAAD